MKKLLLSALSLFAMASASAGVDGTYTVVKYTGHEVGNNYKFSSGETWSSEDPVEEGEEAYEWLVEVSAADGAYTVSNLLGWEEEAAATYDAQANELVIAGGTVVYVDDSGYEYKVCGGFNDYETAEKIMAYCDKNSGYIYNSKVLSDVKLSLDGNNLVAITPILLYIDYYPGSTVHGSAYQMYSVLEMEKNATASNTDQLIGTFVTDKAEGIDIGDDYKFSSGDKWSLEEAEDVTAVEPWSVIITEVEGELKIENLIDWEEVMPCTYDSETGKITIAGGTVMFVDESGYEYKVCGGFGKYDTVSDMASYCDKNYSYIYDTQALKDIELTYEDNHISLVTPIMIYADYYPGSGVHGAAYGIVSQIELSKDTSGVNSVATEVSNAPIEYYNLQGIRLNNPANGQIVIKRQGNTVTKVIIR